MAVMRLLEFRGGTVRGELRFQGRDLLRLSERQMRAVRGREIGLVLQSPLSSLNPAMTIGEQIREAWIAHPGAGTPAWGSLLELLDAVNLPPESEFLDRYPRQISVGQAQRVLIAMAIVHRPALLVADEPTSALDTVTQAEIVKLFARLNRQLGMSILYISHDLLSVASLCHRIAILRQGRMVEMGATEQIFREPRERTPRRCSMRFRRCRLRTNCPADSWRDDRLSDWAERRDEADTANRNVICFRNWQAPCIPPCRHATHLSHRRHLSGDSQSGESRSSINVTARAMHHACSRPVLCGARWFHATVTGHDDVSTGVRHKGAAAHWGGAGAAAGSGHHRPIPRWCTPTNWNAW